MRLKLLLTTTIAPVTMPTRVARTALAALLLGVIAPLPAQTPTTTTARACTAPAPAACRYTKGLLWKIERGGNKPSYLFGTIHISDPRVTNLPAPVRDAFNAAASFTMELIFDGAGITHLAEIMFFNDGRTLEGAIGAKRYAEVQRLLAERGTPSTDLEKKKPWAVVMLLSAPPQSGIALDLQLQVDATLRSKPTYGLETVQEQIAMFDGLAMADQVAMLDSTLRHYRESQKLFESIVQAYVARDLTRLMTLTEPPSTATADDRRVHTTVMERLLLSRNTRMVERMQPRLQQGNAFIAVGAAHLAGERGILPLLEQAGFRVTPIY